MACVSTPENQFTDCDGIVCQACDGDLPDLSLAQPSRHRLGRYEDDNRWSQQTIPLGQDKLLLAVIGALVRHASALKLVLLIGGATVVGQVVSEETWRDYVDRGCAIEGLMRPQSQRDRTWASIPALQTYLQERLRWGMGLSEQQLAQLRSTEQAEAEKKVMDLQRARLTYLTERMRWGMGLSSDQLTELLDYEADEITVGDFVHLIGVDIFCGGRLLSVPHWRGPLARIDGFSVVESDGGEWHDS